MAYAVFAIRKWWSTFLRVCAYLCIYMYIIEYHVRWSYYSFCPNRSINILVHQFLEKELDGWFRRHTIFSDCIADYCTSLWHLTWLYAVILLRNAVYLRACLCSDDFILFYLFSYLFICKRAEHQAADFIFCTLIQKHLYKSAHLAIVVAAQRIMTF